MIISNIIIHISWGNIPLQFWGMEIHACAMKAAGVREVGCVGQGEDEGAGPIATLTVWTLFH